MIHTENVPHAGRGVRGRPSVICLPTGSASGLEQRVHPVFRLAVSFSNKVKAGEGGSSATAPERAAPERKVCGFLSETEGSSTPVRNYLAYSSSGPIPSVQQRSVRQPASAFEKVRRILRRHLRNSANSPLFLWKVRVLRGASSYLDSE